MAFKMNNSPITAKIKRTTQGGMITEPLLDVGTVATMKKPSALKQTSGSDYTPVRTDNANPVPWAFRPDANPLQVWGAERGGSKSGVEGAMGSDRRKAEYDKRNWAYDETISMKSLKAKQKPAKKATASNIAPKPAKVAKVGTKPNNELVTSAPKPKSKKEVRVAKSVDRKTNKASKVRAKGEAALASGNVSKARRLKRREERLKKRAARKASK
jgi:hypothetical protein